MMTWELCCDVNVVQNHSSSGFVTSSNVIVVVLGLELVNLHMMFSAPTMSVALLVRAMLSTGRYLAKAIES